MFTQQAYQQNELQLQLWLELPVDPRFVEYRPAPFGNEEIKVI